VFGLIAPAIVGQFGVKVKPAQVIRALEQIGFTQVYEVALGADIVAIEETREFVNRSKTEPDFMTTSCCPAFVDMVEKG